MKNNYILNETTVTTKVNAAVSRMEDDKNDESAWAGS